MIWEEFRTPPKFGCELPGPKGPGFRRPDETEFLRYPHPCLSKKLDRNQAFGPLSERVFSLS
ncbi:MAG: hypothetical protein KGJ02_03100 [Verrucomicrobiota bacterium]|nr:hypothetical protein [Verrucomicrobiota bacterium]